MPAKALAKWSLLSANVLVTEDLSEGAIVLLADVTLYEEAVLDVDLPATIGRFSLATGMPMPEELYILSSLPIRTGISVGVVSCEQEMYKYCEYLYKCVTQSTHYRLE